MLFEVKSSVEDCRFNLSIVPCQLKKYLVNKIFSSLSSWQTYTSVMKLIFIFVINCLFSSLFQLTTCTVLNGISWNAV